MGNSWETVCIDDIKSPEKYSCVGGPFGSSLSRKHYVDSGVPVVRGVNLSGDSFSESDFVFVSKEKALELQRNMAFRGDLVFTQRGTLGQVALIPDDSKYDQYVVSQSQMKLTVNSEIADPYFVYSYFRTKEAKTLIEKNAIVGGVPHINLGILKEFKLKLPPLCVQKRVANISRLLDNKISLNRQINQTLEQMAQTLFKSWFVDFDPVIDNALDVGNPIPDELQHRAEARKTVRESEGFKPLPDDVRQLFPDAFEESELGWVPKGWEDRQFGDFINRVSVGKKFSQKTALPEGDVPILDQGKSGIIGYHNEQPGVVATIDNPVVVFANHTCYMRLICHNFSAIQNVLPFTGKKVDTVWAYFATKNRISFSEYKGHWPDFVIQKTAVPNPNLTNVFRETVEQMIKKTYQSELETITLTKLRDTLLPKLISGELRLDDVETAVEQETVSA